MTAIGKIYSYPGNPRVFKSLIAAKYNQLVVETPAFEIGKDNKTPDYLKKFPLGKVPAFEGVDGTLLFESNAIALYVAAYKAGSHLVGANAKESALIQQYLAFADNELTPSAAAWVYPVLGFSTFNQAAYDKARENVKRALVALDKVLLERTFLVTERVTIADIVLACTLLPFYTLVFDPSYRSAFKNVTRWFLTCVNQPQFKAVLGDVKLAEQEAKPKAPEPVKPVKKEEPKKEKKEEPMDADALTAEEKPKAKNPLDLLPKSSFVLDEWKRFYSNNDTRPTAVNWFWENYDAEGYSLWKVDYKYNNELTMVFMSSNLVGGFFQRLERARKYAFGSMVILGEDKKNEITGFFVFRGHGIPAEVTEAADYESYTFTRVKESDVKEDFNAVIAWDEKVYGKTFADGKIFK